MKTRILWASLAVVGGLLLVVLLTRALAVRAQGPIAGPPGPWTKYEGNPVVVTGTVGSWDANTVAAPTVISDGTTYKMWYAGLNAASIYSIGYATSTNGITWTKYAGNPVITGTAGSWEANVTTGDVVFDGATYRMWYWGADNIPASINNAIGYATSTNGIKWTKYANNPVIITGTTGSWDARVILAPCVISDAGLYKMWYTGMNSGRWSIGYATSTNGISWTKYDGNPVLVTGTVGSWDASRVLRPDVILDGTTYRMWYTGQAADGIRGIGYATSPDGVSWTKSASNPVLNEGEPGSWEITVMHPDVLLEGNTYKMWYAGGYNTGLQGDQIGYASASAIPPVYLPIIVKGYCGCGPDNYEPNDSFAQAYGPLTSGQTYPSYISCCDVASQRDYFYIDISTKNAINIDLTNIPAGVDYDLYLYNASQAEVARSWNNGNVPEHISYNPPGAGRYYILVFSPYSHYSISPYSLRATYD